MSLGFNLGQTGNATEVGAGVVKVATDAQIAAKVGNDGGVPLVITPDKIPSEFVMDLDYLAGEDLLAGDAVSRTFREVLENVFIYDFTSTASSLLLDELRPRAQEFVTTADPAASPQFIQAYTTGSQTPSFRLSVRETLTGPDLASVTGSGNNQVYTLDVSGVTFTPSTTYYIVFEDIGGAADGNWNGESVVGGGAWYFNGSTWVTQDFQHWARVYYQQATEVPDVIVKTDTSGPFSGNNKLNFVGFVTEDVLTGNPVTVANAPFFTGTGFTPGATYYLSDTPGQISATPGTIQREIGRAVSATKILRKRGPVSPIINTGRNPIAPAQMMFMSLDGTYRVNGVTFNGYVTPLSPGDVITDEGASNAYGRLMDWGYSF